MKSTSLLARIRRPELAIARRHVPESELRESVLTHLRGMCSTRLGSMLTRPDYGIPDVTEMLHSFPEAIATMQRALKRTVDAYEPRLSGVRVNFVPSDGSDLMVRFEIVAQLVGETGKTPIRFETVIEVSRRVTVR